MHKVGDTVTASNGMVGKVIKVGSKQYANDFSLQLTDGRVMHCMYNRGENKVWRELTNPSKHMGLYLDVCKVQTYETLQDVMDDLSQGLDLEWNEEQPQEADWQVWVEGPREELRRFLERYDQDDEAVEFSMSRICWKVPLA